MASRGHAGLLDRDADVHARGGGSSIALKRVREVVTHPALAVELALAFALELAACGADVQVGTEPASRRSMGCAGWGTRPPPDGLLRVGTFINAQQQRPLVSAERGRRLIGHADAVDVWVPAPAIVVNLTDARGSTVNPRPAGAADAR